MTKEDGGKQTMWNFGAQIKMHQHSSTKMKAHPADEFEKDGQAID